MIGWRGAQKKVVRIWIESGGAQKGWKGHRKRSGGAQSGIIELEEAQKRSEGHR